MERGWNLTVVLPNNAGELATASQSLGTAGINIEGFCGVEYEDRCIVNFLFTADSRNSARRIFESHGHKVQLEREVIIVPIEDRPGMLGAYTRACAAAGINLTVAYVAMGSRLVLGADDADSLAAAWDSGLALAAEAR